MNILTLREKLKSSLSSPSLRPSKQFSTQCTCPHKNPNRWLIHLPFSRTRPMYLFRTTCVTSRPAHPNATGLFDTSALALFSPAPHLKLDDTHTFYTIGTGARLQNRPAALHQQLFAGQAEKQWAIGPLEFEPDFERRSCFVTTRVVLDPFDRVCLSVELSSPRSFTVTCALSDRCT